LIRQIGNRKEKRRRQISSGPDTSNGPQEKRVQLKKGTSALPTESANVGRQDSVTLQTTVGKVLEDR